MNGLIKLLVFIITSNKLSGAYECVGTAVCVNSCCVSLALDYRQIQTYLVTFIQTLYFWYHSVFSCENVVNVILDVRSTRKTVRVVAGRRRAVVSNQSVSVALAGVLSRLPGPPQLPEAAPAAQRHPHHPAQLFRVPEAAQLAVVEAIH